MISGLPFDDFRNLATLLPPLDSAAAKVATGLAAGRAGRLLGWFSGATGRPPQVVSPQVAIFAGTHGAFERLAAGTAQRTQAIVDRYGSGGTALNRACASADFGLKVFDLALDVPTGDFTVEPALDERGCAATMAFGMEAVAGGTDLLVLGSLAEGGDAPASALLSVLLEESIRPAANASLVDEALSAHHGHLGDPLEAMRRLGGREIAALAGAILAARMERVAIILDGLPALAAAAAIKALAPEGIAHCILADRGDGAQRRVSELLGMEFLLDLGQEDGTAGVLAASMLKTLGQTYFAGSWPIAPAPPRRH